MFAFPADTPKQECLHDADCHEDKACVEFKCISKLFNDLNPRTFNDLVFYFIR